MIRMVSNTGAKLSYALNVTPTPLQVSLETAPSLATVQIIAVNQTSDTLTVDSLEVGVAIGGNAGDLSAKTSSALTADIVPGSWQLKKVAVGPNEVNDYKWTPPLGATLGPNDSVVITFVGVPVNEALGTTDLTITEGLQGSAPAKVVFEVTKFPFGFYFSNLQVLGVNPEVPVSLVPYKGQVKLKWTGSLTDVTGYTVYYSTNTEQMTSSVTTLGEWTSPQLTANTVFTVQASTPAVGSAEPVTATLGGAVAVQNADVVASSISLGGQPPITSFDQVLPAGTIVMWSGALANIPAGWALCDGTNGTPNLVSRFVFGAGDPANPDTPGAVTPNNTGGSQTHAHTATADVTVEAAGSHHHLVNGVWAATVQATLTLTNTGGQAVVQGLGAGWARTATSGGTDVGQHTHPTSSTVTVNASSNMPPWLALAFIMKLS